MKGNHDTEGRFLTPEDRKRLAREKKARRRGIHAHRWGSAAGLILSDGLLLYMITDGYIDQLFGALFIAVVSVVFTYQIK